MAWQADESPRLKELGIQLLLLGQLDPKLLAGGARRERRAPGRGGYTSERSTYCRIPPLR